MSTLEQISKEIEGRKSKDCELINEDFGNNPGMVKAANDGSSKINNKKKFLKNFFSKRNKK